MTLSDFVWSLLVGFFLSSNSWVLLKILQFSLKVMLKHEKLRLLIDADGIQRRCLNNLLAVVPHVIEIASKNRIVKNVRVYRSTWLWYNVLMLSKWRHKRNPFHFSSAIKCHQMCCINNIRWCVMIFHFYRSLMGCVCLCVLWAFPGWFVW